ncbi:MAG: DUF1573 domain-containing protein [Flavobacteriales bacterium]|nr:DUF1573 domain-containing protein [Flavobacteriales bacterium]
MKENIKIALLGIIALTLVIDTFILDESSSDLENPKSNIVANPTNQNNIITPNNPITIEPPKMDNHNHDKPSTTVKFAEMSHNFGEIMQDSKNTYVFKFTNTGKEPLIIENATGSCGCTVPTYPKHPIAPGETGDIEVVYSPGKQQGEQNKTVSITANTEPHITTLNISAVVKTP